MDFMNRIQEIESRMTDIQQQVNRMAPTPQGDSPDFSAYLSQQMQTRGGANGLPQGVTAWVPGTNPMPAIPSDPSLAAPAPTPGAAQFEPSITSAANEFGVDPNLVKSVIQQESAFNPTAKSNCGALGLMQLMPETAKGLNCDDPLNPEQNIRAGTKYLKSLLDRFHGDTSLALAAYNAGPNSVDKYQGIPPFAETQNYVKNILANYSAYRRGTT